MFTLAVFRVEKTKDYTTMSNHHLKNRNLSLKAVGIMSKILSLPDDWDYTLRGLSKLTSDGIDSVRAAIRELEAAGYIVRSQSRDAHGRLSKNEYTVYEIPHLLGPSPDNPSLDIPSSENPTTVIPSTENPSMENPTQVNTKKKSIIQGLKTNSINYPSINHSAFGTPDGMDVIDVRERYRKILEDNLEVDIIRDRYNADSLDEIVEIMLDAICSTNTTIRINGEEMPQAVVKSRFLKLRSSHIEYVFDALKQNPSDIRNIRSYLLTTLYNASLTMDNYYTALVNHDMSH